MSKYVEELHNHEDASNLVDSILLFVAGTVILLVIGSAFWSAF